MTRTTLSLKPVMRPTLSTKPRGWLEGKGRLVYDPRRKNKNNTREWLVVEVDREITRLFRWFVDRELMNITGVEDHGILQPSGDAHISVIRGEKDLRRVPQHEKDALWGKYQGQVVSFLYSPVVRLAKGEFWFVEVKCPQLIDIRKEFDLPYDYGMHLTIGKMRDHWIGKFDGRLRSSLWNGKIDV